MAREVALVENIKGTSRKILDENLQPGEEVVVLMEGTKGQVLAATPSRLLLIKTGFGSGGFGVGKKSKSFSYDHITSIDCSKGMAFGRFQVSAAGTKEVSGGYFTGAFDAENVINFGAGGYEKFLAATNKVRELMTAFATARSGSHAAPVAESVPDQILKLAQLRDAGILTEDEFQTKKVELLARI